MAIEKEIQARQAEFMKAFNSNEASIAAKFYASGCHFMPAGQEAAHGPVAVEAFFKKDFGEGLKSLELMTEEVNGSGEWAFERGTYKANGILGPETGSYITVWRKEGGKWMIYNDCFNVVKPHG